MYRGEACSRAPAAAAVAGFTWKSTGPFIRDAKAATLELRWLGWEHYNVKSLTAEFENRHDVKVSAGFFDGNSEAWNKLRAGGTQDFDLVMADGFWPRLYAKQGAGTVGRLFQAGPQQRVRRLRAPQVHTAACGGQRGHDRRAQLLGRVWVHGEHGQGRGRRSGVREPAVQREV